MDGEAARKTSLSKHSLNPPSPLPPVLSERSLQLLFVSLTHKWKKQVINIVGMIGF